MTKNETLNTSNDSRKCTSLQCSYYNHAKYNLTYKLSVHIRYVQCWVGACHEAYLNYDVIFDNDVTVLIAYSGFIRHCLGGYLARFLTHTWVFSRWLEFVQNHAPTIAVPQCTTHRCVQTDPKVVQH